MRSTYPRFFAFLFFASLLGAPALADKPAKPPDIPADLVLHHGAIYTVDGREVWAEAVAIRSGVYVAVGRDQEVSKWIGPATQVVDLAGAMVMPGINDVHQHPLDGGYEMLYACKFGARVDFDGMLDAVRACVKKSQPGDWIVGGAWGSQHLERLANLDALRALDAVSDGHPVFLRDDTFHNRWVNSSALERAGISIATASPAGGDIVKDAASGQPTGLIKEFPAFHAIEALIPPRQPARMIQAAAAAIRFNNSLGITGIQDAYTPEGYLKVWGALDRSQDLSAWLVASMPAMPAPDPAERYGSALVAVREQYRSTHVLPNFAKIFLDGVPPARTSLFIDPYLADAAHGAHFHGSANYSLAHLTEVLATLDQIGVPVKLHATGDGSVRLALDAIAQVRKINGNKGQQHQIAHASFVSPEDILRFKQLNVVADESPMLWFPTGLWYATAAAIGERRAARFWPVKDLQSAGTLVAGGSDWPAGQDTPNPWVGIEGMVTRRNPLGEIPGALWPEQAIDLASSVRTYTLNSAKAMGLGSKTGSIELGKSADLIILDRNLFKIPIEQVHQTKVIRTYFQGKQVFLQ